MSNLQAGMSHFGLNNFWKTWNSSLGFKTMRTFFWLYTSYNWFWKQIKLIPFPVINLSSILLSFCIDEKTKEYFVHDYMIAYD